MNVALFLVILHFSEKFIWKGNPLIGISSRNEHRKLSPQPLALRGSGAFEVFLATVYKYEEIRLSEEFQDFFYNHDLRIAYRYMSQGDYQEAIPYLQNTLHLQEKMLGLKHPDTARTQCALIVAYTSLEGGEAHVHGYAESAWKASVGTRLILLSSHFCRS